MQLQEVLGKLGEEKARSEALLCRCLPKEIAQRLQNGDAVPPTLHSNLTIVFADIVSFTSLSAVMEPLSIINSLNSLYQRFDKIIEQYPGG